MSRLTWKKPNGEWGVKGVDLSTLPPVLYGMAHKLLDFEDLCESPDTLATHMYQLSDLKADLAHVTAERDVAKRALYLAIETHSVDQRQIERLARYYMEQARGPQKEE